MSAEQLHADLNAIRSVLNEGASARSPQRTIIAVGNLVCGIFMLLAVPVLLIVFSLPALTSPHEDGVLIPLFIGLAIIAVLLLLASPFMAAWWGLQRNKSWGIMAALIAGALNLMNFPLGTVLAVYTFWAVSSGKLAPDMTPRRC